MAARVYSQFPERKLTHDRGRPAQPAPPAAPVTIREAPWPGVRHDQNPWPRREAPKSSGGTFYQR